MISQQKTILLQAKKQGIYKEVKSKMNIILPDAKVSESEDDNKDSDECSDIDSAAESKDDRKEKDANDKKRILFQIQYKKRKAMGNMDEAVHSADHMREKKITQIWNQVLFEIKCVRDYYVNEAVLPKSVVADPTFFNFTTFHLKFLVQKHHLYNEERPSGGGDSVLSPAIMYFFKSKFIIQGKKVGNTNKTSYGSLLDVSLAEPNAVVIPNYRVEASEVDKLVSMMFNPRTPTSRELKDTLKTLIELTNIPMGVTPFIID